MNTSSSHELYRNKIQELIKVSEGILEDLKEFDYLPEYVELQKRVAKMKLKFIDTTIRDEMSL